MPCKDPTVCFLLRDMRLKGWAVDADVPVSDSWPQSVFAARRRIGQFKLGSGRRFIRRWSFKIYSDTFPLINP